MRESVEERRRRILDVLDQHGEVKVAHLAALLNVSMVTVRRDLEVMSNNGGVQRRHGMVARADAVAASNSDDSAAQGTVAIIAPERHSYLGAVTAGARNYLMYSGYRAELHLTPNTANPERQVIEEISRGNVDGLLLAPRWRTLEQEDAAAALLENLALPTVLLERHPSRTLPLESVDSVCSDHWHGVHLAIEHLISRGHGRILLAARQDSPTARAVNTAFAEIASAHPDIEHWMTVLSAPDAVVGSVGRIAEDESAAETPHRGYPDHDNPQWLANLVQEHSFTAVLIHSDENALVLSQRLTASAMRVPEDCAVIAYDDVVAGLGSTPLTAVSPPKEEVGRTGAMLLSQRIRAERSGELWTPHRVKLLPTLRIRAST